MQTKVAVIIPAAGTGSRMGGSIPKPYLNIEGETVLSRTLRCFNHSDYVEQVIVAVSPECKDIAENAAKSAGLLMPITFVDGGRERMYSIANALKVLNEGVEIVAVHDAVRPFLSKSLFVQLIEKCVEMGACIPGMPVTDTIKMVDQNNVVTSTPTRDFLRSIQTPQIFSRTLLTDAYRYALEKGKFATDDAAVVEYFGGTIAVIPGDENNFKLTYPSDIKRAVELIKKSS